MADIPNNNDTLTLKALQDMLTTFLNKQEKSFKSILTDALNHQRLVILKEVKDMFHKHIPSHFCTTCKEFPIVNLINNGNSSKFISPSFFLKDRDNVIPPPTTYNCKRLPLSNLTRARNSIQLLASIGPSISLRDRIHPFTPQDYKRPPVTNLTSNRNFIPPPTHIKPSVSLRNDNAYQNPTKHKSGK
ncbi:hypothetical protein JCGZ_19384 [Jatropha curcas]|uniref:Uncharacterized protein n=1 Tax=Jatropha curcas TaxID=180498 RepID=A0A067K3D4_JATCU|nr:hypothetical protein JCGZ_19384 [Jatropha curcas]